MRIGAKLTCPVGFCAILFVVRPILKCAALEEEIRFTIIAGIQGGKMFSFAKFLLVFLLVFAPFRVLYAIDDSGKISDADTVAVFDGGSVPLSEVLSTIDSIEKKKGVALTFERKVELLNATANGELFYRKALEKGIDKDPGIMEQIKTATKKIIVDAVVSDLLKDITISEEEIQEFYRKNEGNIFFKPELYNGFVYFVAKEEGAIPDSTDSRVREVANKIKQLIIENKYELLPPSTLQALWTENPDLSIVSRPVSNYSKRQVTPTDKKRTSSTNILAFEKLTELSPGTIEIVSVDAQSAAVVFLKSATSAEKGDLSHARNIIIATLKAIKEKAAYDNFIEKLRNEYHLQLKSDLLK